MAMEDLNLSYRLSKEPATPYSNSERRLFGLLGDEPKSTLELVDAFYTDGWEAPFNGRQTITSLLSTLIKKLEFNKEPFSIQKSPRRGPVPVDYRVVQKAKRKRAMA
jgi:hypothetical protein